MAEQLPNDLIVEILCRLPVKTMIGLKLVSKTWHGLISNVCAPRLSAAAAAHPSGFLFRCRIDEEISDYECFGGYARYPGGRDCDGNSDGFVDSYSELLPFQLSSEDYFECCNGLLLCIRGGEVRQDPQYYVCNPTTKQCVAIPNPHRRTHPFSAALAFDPTKSCRYKVVRFIYTTKCYASYPPKLDIFSSDTGKWVRRRVNLSIEVPVGDHQRRCVRRAIYLDGMLYKLCFTKYLLRFDLNSSSDVAIEVPRKDELPLEYTSGDCGFMGVAKGRLHYSNHDASKSSIFVWVLEEHCKGVGPLWTLRHCISMDYLMSKYPAARNLYLHFNAYAIHPTADIIFLGIPSTVICYNLESNKLEEEEEAFRMKMGREIEWGQYSLNLFSPCYVVLSDFSNKPDVFSSSKHSQLSDDIVNPHFISTFLL